MECLCWCWQLEWLMYVCGECLIDVVCCCRNRIGEVYWICDLCVDDVVDCLDFVVE